MCRLIHIFKPPRLFASLPGLPIMPATPCGTVPQSKGTPAGLAAPRGRRAAPRRLPRPCKAPVHFRHDACHRPVLAVARQRLGHVHPSAQTQIRSDECDSLSRNTTVELSIIRTKDAGNTVAAKPEAPIRGLKFIDNHGCNL